MWNTQMCLAGKGKLQRPVANIKPCTIRITSIRVPPPVNQHQGNGISWHCNAYHMWVFIGYATTSIVPAIGLLQRGWYLPRLLFSSALQTSCRRKNPLFRTQIAFKMKELPHGGRAKQLYRSTLRFSNKNIFEKDHTHYNFFRTLNL